MQKKRLIGKRGPCLAVLAVLLFAGLFMATCLLDGIDNDEGQGTLLVPLGADQKNVPPVVNNPPRGQPVIDNPPAEPPVIDNPPEADDPPVEPPVIDNPPVTDNPPEEQPGASIPPPPIQELGTFPGLDAETERQLKLDWISTLQHNSTVDDIRIERYYGNYNGCVVVLMEGGGDDAPVSTTISIAGMEFGFDSSNVFKVWYQAGGPGSGRFYDVAVFYYNSGLLREANIRSMYKVHTGEEYEGEPPEQPGNNREPYLRSGSLKYGTFPGLDVETERQIRLDYLDLRPNLVEAYGRDDAAIQYAVHMTQYYGNYSGCELVSIASSGGGSRTTVAGMVFVSTSLVGRDRILVWKRGENPSPSYSYPKAPFYWLDQAYDLGFLTLEDVENLYKRFYEIFPYLEGFITQRPLPPMPDHLCDFWGYKVPNCTFEGCEW